MAIYFFLEIEKNGDRLSRWTGDAGDQRGAVLMTQGSSSPEVS
jgi:hypothetical protein